MASVLKCAKENGNLSNRMEFYSPFIIEKLQNSDHILTLLHERGIFQQFDINRFENSSLDENLNFAKSYNSLRRSPNKRPVSIISLDKELRQTLEREFECRSIRKSTWLVYTLQEKIASLERDKRIFDDILNIFRETQNGFISELLQVDPDYIPIGKREWEKIVLEMWDDLVSFVDYDLLAPYLLEHNVLSKKQHKYYVDNIKNREDRIANLLLLLSDRFQGLNWLTKSLQNEGSVRYVQLAQLCTILSEEESSLLNCHKHFILSHIDKVLPIVNELYNSGGINSKDKKRICNPFLSGQQMKIELIRTLNRKRPGIVALLKECCHRTENLDISVILDFNPATVFHWEEVEKLKLDWDYLICHVSYEHIYRYFIFRKFIDEKEHQRIQNLPTNSDKIRQILAKLPRRNGAYDAFFQILALKEEYSEVIQRCLTMDFEEAGRLLEVQDFLWEHLQYMELIVEKLISLKLIDIQEANFIISQYDQFGQNLALLNAMKQKGPGTVDKLVEIFSLTDNRNCSEILAVDFRSFKMTTEEWTKLKVYWCKFVNEIRYKSISSILIEANVISLVEHQWIVKSEKNRQRMRKFLRILPSKKDGYKTFLSAISTVKQPTYQKILFECALMCPDDLQQFYANYDFMVKNTKHINVLLNDLEEHGIISHLQKRIINCYNENRQVEELYIVLLGKDAGIFSRAVGSFTRSGNNDVAAVLNMNLKDMTTTVEEWKALTASWTAILDTVDYNTLRQNCTTSHKLLSMKEDREISRCRNGAERMRKLLQIIPFKVDGFRNFISVLMKNSSYENIAWSLMKPQK